MVQSNKKYQQLHTKQLYVNGTNVTSALDGLTSSAAEINTLDGAISAVTMVVGVEGTNAINVTIQLQDAGGSDVAFVGHVHAYLSDASTGLGISATAPATSVAIGTDGAIIVEEVAKLAWWLQSESDGDIDLTITETGIDTWYLVIVLPDGSQTVSGAITFA